MSSNSVLGQRSRTARTTRNKSAFVPRLEVLESRDLLSTFTVTNTSADVNTSGSLPWAIQQTNTHPGLNAIDFNIPGSGTHVIQLTANNYIVNPTLIDGTSQPGYRGTPLISVWGNANVSSEFFFGTGSAGSTVQGLDLYGFTANAVTMMNGATNNLIQDNWMGFYISPSGQVFLNSAINPNFTSDIGIRTSNNTVRNNVLSGVYNALSMGEDPSQPWSGTVYSGNSITGNFFGTDPSGTTAQNFGNQSDAIFLGSGCQGNFFGPNNVMSGALHGVEINSPSAQNNVIFLNKIGTDVSGNYAIPNTDGIDLSGGSQGNTIGGSFGGNLISGNSGAGVSVGVPGFGNSNNNYVENNIIGLNGSQTAAIGAGGFAVTINEGSSGNNVQGNVLAAGSLGGVLIQQSSNNNVSGNWIGESAGGTGFHNANYGVGLINGSDNNTVLGNAFGLNDLGPIYIDSTSVGNNTGGGTSSALNIVQQYIQEFESLEQALYNYILSVWDQLVQYIENVEQQIIQEVSHTT